MLKRFLLVMAACLTVPGVQAAEPLSSGEAQRIGTARAAALKSPAVKEVNDKYKVARKAYQLDRAKFPNDRNHQVAVDYRKATKELDDAVRKAMLAADPTIAALLEKAERKPNEGETVADSDVAQNPAIRAIKDEPGLPRVLLIGDSISIGYTLQVREKLKGQANVHRIPVNGGATEVGLEKLKEWLGDGRWDVIHFNFGLHDAKYASETTQRSSREQYADNLRKLVKQMKATGAKLIFATTTPVPKDGILSPTRKFDNIPARNEIAVKVMQENGVAIDDLYTVVLPEQEKVGRPNDVHYAPEGYELLAKAVAASIATQLPPKSSQRSLDIVGQIAAAVEPSRKLTYKKVGDRELHLHVFEPQGHQPTDRRACFVTIHGGGWTGGEPRRMYPFATHAASLGLVGISVEYRLLKAPSTVFDCVKDGRSALRYVRAHAAELGVDPQKIIANGSSAGGHVAAATALFEGVDEAGEDTSVSCVPNALVLFFPVIDTSKQGYGQAKIGDRWKELSPVDQVRSGVPPTLIFHGTADPTTPFAGAQAFHQAMLKSGNRCELVVHEGGDHGYFMRDRALYDDTLKKINAFLASLGWLTLK